MSYLPPKALTWFVAAALCYAAVPRADERAARRSPGRPAGEHWAWLQPKRPPIPAVRRTDWPRNPIDHFVLARLEREGIQPSPEADRSTLARRAALDLTGLPPSPDRLHQFLADDRPDAFERYVDRLLADPGYGERWARMWLDLARYADSKGYGSDPLRTIWRYRDWVIDAFNRNVPYDRFTIEQIAGDLLSDPSHEQLLATAFHRNTMANDEGGTDDEQFRVEAVKDRVDTTMQVWMGVTMGCAKCHTHKFDPISHEEYYQFFAFFNQTEDADRGDEEPRMRSPSREQQYRLDRLASDIASLRGGLEAPPADRSAAQAEWEGRAAGEARSWVVLRSKESRSSNGTEFEALDDGSLLARGAGPASDTYSITFTVPQQLRSITALRLDLLPHESLPGQGPGRAGGSFVLNDFRLSVPRPDGDVPAARFVRIEIPGPQRILSLAEVQVFRGADGAQPAGENLARSGSAKQSSVDYNGPARLAIDGNTNGHYFEAKSTTHTRLEDNPWWELDLGADKEIGQVVVWNRSDGGVGTRLNNFRVSLLDRARKPVWEKSVVEPPSPSVALGTGGPVPVPIARADSSFDQIEFPVVKAIDSDAGARSGWGVSPEGGRGHVAVFELASSLEVEPGTALTVTLVQAFGSNHTIGRLRLSAASAKAPQAVPAAILEALALAAGDRTESQRGEIARFYHVKNPALQPIRDQIARLEKERRELDKQVPMIPVLRELPADKRRATHVLLKSNFMLQGDAVEPAVPSALHDFSAGSQRNRLGLAEWLVSRDNPLTARVAVNRFWSQLFGRGIVETEEDFGTQGLPPSHPELLDWLAVEFMDPAGGAAWDMKALLRSIVTSATYRQSSTASDALLQRDPDNLLFARGPRHRLEAEAIRDQALALAGLLSRKVGGPSVYPPQPPGLWRAAFNGERTWATSTNEDRYRRGVYTFWRRTVPYPSMATFDAPSREICSVRRVPTNTPLQAFVTLNDPVFVECAQALARRIVREAGSTVRDRAAFGLTLCLSRAPQPEQVDQLVRLFEQELEYYRTDVPAARQISTDPLGELPAGSDAAELAAWTVVANVLLNLDGVLAKR